MTRFLGLLDRRSPSRLRPSSSLQTEPTADRSPKRPTAQDTERAGPGKEVSEIESIDEIAARGARGSGRPLPQLDKLQEVFPGHRLSELRIHADSQAHRATEELGAVAYTRGNDLVFGTSSPDLLTLAHETTHALQQQAGLRPEGGVGRPHDQLEEQAHAASRAAVAGQPAGAAVSNLLPSRPGACLTGTTAVQLFSIRNYLALGKKYGTEALHAALANCKQRLANSWNAEIAEIRDQDAIDHITDTELEREIQRVASGAQSSEAKEPPSQPSTPMPSSVPVPSTPQPSAGRSDGEAKQKEESKVDLSRYENITWSGNSFFAAKFESGQISSTMNCYEFVMSFAIDHGFISADELRNIMDTSRIDDQFNRFIDILYQQAQKAPLSESKDFAFGDIIFFVSPRAHTFMSLGGGKAVECRETNNENHVHEIDTLALHETHKSDPQFMASIVEANLHGEMARKYPSYFRTPERFIDQKSSAISSRYEDHWDNWDDMKHRFIKAKDNESTSSIDHLNQQIENKANGWNQTFFTELMELPIFRVRKADWIAAVKRAQTQHPSK